MSDNVQTDNTNVKVTPEAAEEIKRVLAEDQYVGKAVRLTIAGFGCGGPQLGLALDEPEGNEADVVYKSEGVIILADDQMKSQINQLDGLTMEYINDPARGKGLDIQFNKQPAAGGCGSCSAC